MRGEVWLAAAPQGPLRTDRVSTVQCCGGICWMERSRGDGVEVERGRTLLVQAVVMAARGAVSEVRDMLILL